MTRREIRRALVSVSDKTGLVELTRALTAADVEIVSTGSTAATIADAGLPVVPVEQVTGFAECLDGRVKTLHPAIHAGILADVTNDEHAAALVDLGISSFDLVVVNLYPFRETVASGADDPAVVEMIDIGGPAMVRAAAKNHRCVAVVVDPADYDAVVDAVRQGGFTDPERRRLAGAAFAHTASYDTAVASYFGAGRPPSFFGVAYDSVESLRYGENPHQWAGVYRERDGIGLAGALQHGGKDMSYNNYVDADAALRAAFDFADPAVAIIKHANPCGIAVGQGHDPIADAHDRANACDPLSAFGGVIAANRPVTLAAARQIAEIFTEVIVAPGYDEGAIDVLCARPGLRILQVSSGPAGGLEWRRIDGGVLVQQPDRLDADGDDPAAWTLAAGEAADAATLSDLVFAWRAVRAVRSNAILIAHQGATVGIGMGQVNRVDAARLAVERSAGRAQGAVAASDAFFPFPDGLAILLDAGIRAVVQPGGSVRDPEVLELARERGISMYLTGARHFTH